jgi:hypothetical protein
MSHFQLRWLFIYSCFLEAHQSLFNQAMDIANLLEWRDSAFTLNPSEPREFSPSTQQFTVRPAYSDHSLIPCPLDTTGSSAEARKRKANAAASRRFRQRNRQETELNMLVTKLQKKIQLLEMVCGFYRSEREHFRQELFCSSSKSFPPRPRTPQPEPDSMSTPPTTS